MSEPKILTLDIEWKPTKALVWQPWKVNVGPDQIVEHGGLLCVGAKWLGQKKVHLFSEWKHGRERMVKSIHEMLEECDAVVTYNGDKFDLPKLHGEFLLQGLAPPPPLTSIDLIKPVRKLGFFMNRLGFIGPFLGLSNKLEHEGINLWKKVEAGDKDAQRRMADYCRQDVQLTEDLYIKVLPYIKNHPYLGDTDPTHCGSCGSEKLQKRGHRRTRCYNIQRIQCQNCGSWQSGKRTKVN